MTKELEVAIQAAKEAGQIMVEGWETDLVVTSKADNSLVTKIDGLAEEKIIATIKKTFPDYKIMAEESGSQGSSGYCWYIDPIDGTTNYSRRVPICGVNIALAKDNQVVLGVFFNPFTNELYYAEKDFGSFLNDKKIATSDVTQISNAVLAFSYSHDPAVREKAVQMGSSIMASRTKREYGSVAYELALVASGRLDAAIHIGHNDWDYAAGSILIKEAGGVVVDFSGQDWELNGKDMLTVGNKELERALQKLLTNF